jgi:hypothetical protein
MKIAVFMTGHFRDAPKTIENYAQFLNRTNDEVDFYVGTWSNYDVHREEWKIIDDKVNVREISEYLFGNQLKGLWIGDAIKYESGESPSAGSPPRTLWADHCSKELLESARNSPPFHPGEYPNLNYYFHWMQRLLDQYYVIHEIYKISKQLELYDTYDVCLKIRGDMSFIEKPPIPIEQNEDGIHFNGYAWIDNGTHDYTNISPWGLGDQMAWGSPYWMRKYFEYAIRYCSIFPSLVKPESCSPRFNGTVYPPHIQNTFYADSGHMLAYYLLKYPYFTVNSDCDVQLHKHGHEHTDVRTPTGVVLSYDYYDIMSRWRYG